jgi:hypothetical protein
VTDHGHHNAVPSEMVGVAVLELAIRELARAQGVK